MTSESAAFDHVTPSLRPSPRQARQVSSKSFFFKSRPSGSRGALSHSPPHTHLPTDATIATHIPRPLLRAFSSRERSPGFYFFPSTSNSPADAPYRDLKDYGQQLLIQPFRFMSLVSKPCCPLHPSLLNTLPILPHGCHIYEAFMVMDITQRSTRRTPSYQTRHMKSRYYCHHSSPYEELPKPQLRGSRRRPPRSLRWQW